MSNFFNGGNPFSWKNPIANPSGSISGALVQVPHCKLNFSGSTAFTDGVSANLSFNTEVYDFGEMVDIVNAPTRITFRKQGVYQMTAQIRWATNVAVISSHIFFLTNGTTAPFTEKSYMGAPASVQLGVVLTHPKRIAAGDYVELAVMQNGGSPTMNLLDAYISATFLSAF